MANAGVIDEAAAAAKHCHGRPRYNHGALATRTLGRLIRENALWHSANIRAVILRFVADQQRGSSTE